MLGCYLFILSFIALANGSVVVRKCSSSEMRNCMAAVSRDRHLCIKVSKFAITGLKPRDPVKCLQRLSLATENSNTTVFMLGAERIVTKNCVIDHSYKCTMKSYYCSIDQPEERLTSLYSYCFKDYTVRYVKNGAGKECFKTMIFLVSLFMYFEIF